MNNLLSFLDIEAVRGNNKVTTSVYPKTTFSGVSTLRVLYLSRTNTPFLRKVFQLCSNFEVFHQEIGNLKNIFRKNDYLVNLTGFCIKKYLDNLYVKKEVYLLAPKNS